nr:TonB-dependent receptor [uncultured Polynucleobacter sp.]
MRKERNKRNNRNQSHKVSKTTLGAAVAMIMVSTSQTAFTQTTDAQTKSMGQVEVKAKYDEESNRYNRNYSNIGKITQEISDIPQAITVIPEGLLEDQNATTLKEGLRNVPGLTFNAGEGGRIGDNMNIRGFYSFGDLYVDGIRDTAQYNRDLFNVTQVDVLRGAASMLFGRGQAGGVINEVSKTPFLMNKSNVAITAGSYDYYRGTADMNTVLDAETSTAFRLNAVAQDAKSSRDVVQNKTLGFAPTVTYGIGTHNQISLSYYYLDTDNVPDYGIGFVNQKPLNTATGFSGTTQDYEKNTTQLTTLSQQYTFDKDTSLNTKIRYSAYDRSLWSNKGRSVLPVTTLALAGPRGGEEATTAIQSDFNKNFTTGSMNHALLTGFEIYNENAQRYSYNTTGCNTDVIRNNVIVRDNCTYGYGNQVKNPSSIFNYQGNTMSVYGQGMVEVIPQWKVLGGVRQDWLRASFNTPGTSLGPTGQASLNFAEPSFRAGLLHQPNLDAAYYLTWSDSFNPTADLYQLSAGTGYPAERSAVTELGAKWNVTDNGLALRTALYQAVKKWERNTDVTSSSSIDSVRRHTNGLEVELTGNITDKWDVFSGAALMSSIIDEQGYSGTTRQNPNLVGMRARNAPAYTYNIWTTYKVAQNWKVGGGVFGVGQRQVYGLNTSTAPITANQVPAYARVDAMLQYDIKDYSLKLNVMNLFNTTNYESVYVNGGFAIPGTLRSYQMQAVVRF